MYLSVQAVREARQEVLDKIEAINTVATDESRELTPDEVKAADELLAQHDKLVQSEKTAAKYEAAQMDLVRNSPQNSIATSTGPGRPSANLQPVPQPQLGNRDLRAFRADTRAQAEQDAYDAGMFLVATCSDRDDREANPRLYRDARQHCQDRGLIRGDAQTLDDDAKGGYLAAHTLQRSIIRIVQEVGISRRICNVVPMPTETLSQPKRSGGLTVYSPTEDAAITASEMQWSNVNLIARDRATLTKISNKLLRSGSTIASVADQVATEIGYAFAYEEDSELIDGDMTATYFNVGGLETKLGTAGINTTTTTTQDTWIELVNQNFTDTMALLPGKFWRRQPVWLCSPAFYYAAMVRLMAAGGGNTFATLEGGASQVPAFLGYPVLFTEFLPTATAVSTIHAFFGNFYDSVMLGDRAGISIARSDHRYFDENSVALRGIYAYDIVVHEGGDASNAGGYVALKTGAAS